MIPLARGPLALKNRLSGRATALNVGTDVCPLVVPPIVPSDDTARGMVGPDLRRVAVPPVGATLVAVLGADELLVTTVGRLVIGLLFGNAGNKVLRFPLSCDPDVTIRLLLY